MKLHLQTLKVSSAVLVPKLSGQVARERPQSFGRHRQLQIIFLILKDPDRIARGGQAVSAVKNVPTGIPKL